MLITRPDAAIFYSESDGADGSWEFSHCVEALLVRECGATVMLVTHQLQFAERADHVVVLERGTIAAQGPPAQLAAELAALRRVAAEVRTARSEHAIALELLGEKQEELEATQEELDALKRSG